MKWSSKDIEFLRNNYPSEDLNYCSQYLNRTIQALRTKAHKLNIKRSSTYYNLKTNEIYDLEIVNKPLLRLDDYIGANIPITHKCKICSNTWKISPSHILNGSSCIMCSPNKGYKDNKFGTLYLVELDIGDPNKEPLYKLGITNNTVKERLGSDLLKFKGTICWTLSSENGSKIRSLESELKAKYKDYQYNTGLLKSGNTETFTVYINKPKLPSGE